MIFKYVIIDGVHPVLFFHGIQHADMKKLGDEVSGAFVNIADDGTVSTIGESLSLGTKASDDDAEIIKNAIARMRL